MQILIDIPEEDYELLKKSKYLSPLEASIKYGVALPKNHGRLIDADALKETFIESNIYLKYTEKGFWCVTGKEIKNAPTIIEAYNNGE